MAHRPDDLPVRFYWLAAAVAVALIVFLYWFTTHFNIPLGTLIAA